MRKQSKLIETIQGNGKVFKKDVAICDAMYSIEVWQEFLDDIPGIKDIRGKIYILDGQRDLADGSIMTLKLNDQRVWRFFAESGNPVTGVFKVVNASESGLEGSLNQT